MKEITMVVLIMWQCNTNKITVTAMWLKTLAIAHSTIEGDIQGIGLLYQYCAIL